MLPSISSESFYGPKTPAQIRLEAKIAKKLTKGNVYHTSRIPGVTNLLGPPKTCTEFKKQLEAMAFRKAKDGETRKNKLMCFAFEKYEGTRSFFVSHPLRLWTLINSYPPNRRCFYEIIEEHVPSKLYMDLEFEFAYNPLSNGNRMVQTLCTILAVDLTNTFSIGISPNMVLQLDATTSSKFSRHLIYQIPSVAFRNNYSVGNFISQLCKKIKDACLSDPAMSKFCDNYGVTSEEVKELQIFDRKGNLTLFIDSCVYTKNRHFRLFNCTKLNKNNPLLASSQNLYVPQENLPHSLFIDSLITYFSNKYPDILDYGPVRIPQTKLLPTLKRCEKTLNTSPMVSLHEFLNDLVSPKGRVKRNTNISNSDVVVYDVIGYRYCGNIEREHRSNHIRYVVLLNKGVYYQKCLDPDCATYKSPEVPLPASVILNLNDTADQDFLDVTDSLLTDESLIQLLFEDDVPDMGLSDNEIIAIAEFNDSVLQVV